MLEEIAFMLNFISRYFRPAQLSLYLYEGPNKICQERASPQPPEELCYYLGNGLSTLYLSPVHRVMAQQAIFLYVVLWHWRASRYWSDTPECFHPHDSNSLSVGKGTREFDATQTNLPANTKWVVVLFSPHWIKFSHSNFCRQHSACLSNTAMFRNTPKDHWTKMLGCPKRMMMRECSADVRRELCVS